ncbi:hypothetical protein TRAPUB_13109, partial [Trametes pubescens]
SYRGWEMTQRAAAIRARPSPIAASPAVNCFVISDVAFRNSEEERAHYESARGRLAVLTTIQGELAIALKKLRRSHASIVAEVNRLEIYVASLAPPPRVIEANTVGSSPVSKGQKLQGRRGLKNLLRIPVAPAKRFATLLQWGSLSIASS